MTQRMVHDATFRFLATGTAGPVPAAGDPAVVGVSSGRSPCAALEGAPMMHVPEKYRVTAGVLASDARSGNNGAFRVPVGSVYLAVVASDGLGWEHVSVSHAAHIPTWDEMCAIKDLFWDE